MYTIRAEYETGNSFNSEIDQEVLDVQWSSLDRAVENIKRLRDHYRAYNDRYELVACMSNKAESMLDTIKTMPWYSPRRPNEMDYWESEVILVDDDGNNMVPTRIPWTGYFERLIKLEIIVAPADNDDYPTTVDF